MTRARSLRSNLSSFAAWLFALALLVVVLTFTAAQVRAALSGLDRDTELVAELLIEEGRGPLLFADRGVLADEFRALRMYPGIAGMVCTNLKPSTAGAALNWQNIFTAPSSEASVASSATERMTKR